MRERDAPKRKSKTVKSAPKTADRTVSNSPKVLKAADAVGNTMSAVRTAAAKQAAEIRHSAEVKANESDKSENYAIDTIEERTETAASAVSNTARNAARSYVHRKIQNKRAENQTLPNERAPNTAQTDTVGQNLPKTADSNAPKTADGSTPKTKGGNQPKTRQLQQAAAKQKASRINKQGERVTGADRRPERPTIKTKEQYAGKKQAEALESKSVKAADKAAGIKTKESYIRQRSEAKARSEPIKAKQAAQRKYVADKLRGKAAAERAAEEKAAAERTGGSLITEPKPVLPEKTADVPKHTGVETPVQKPLGRMSIKTKENYISSIRTKPPEVIKPATKLAPKQNPHTITRSVQGTSRSVKTKAKASADTVKSGRNIFKASRTMKRRTVKAQKTAVKTQKQAAKKAAVQAAKRTKELAKRSAQTAKKAARTAFRLTIKVVQAVAAAAKALVSSLLALGGGAVVLIVLIIIIIMAAIAASPFGIFFSEEVHDTGTIPLSQIIAEYNVELTQEVEDIETSVEHTDVEVIDNQADTNTVIAVFAAKTAGTEDDSAQDVVIFDEEKAELLKDYFRTANTVTYETMTVELHEETRIYLTIKVDGLTKDELMDLYDLTDKQREAVETLLAHGDILTASSHSLAITDASVEEIIRSLPASLPQERKDVVKNAGSLVGKVNYFWGGKSDAIGWDSAWGSMQRVTAEGSPSSGSIRSYGLDCSGYVSWAFHNSGMYAGDGTYGQRDNSRAIAPAAAQPGDLAFLSSYSHVGIVVGRDADGNILVMHCSSSANNVVISTAASVGFSIFRRPNCY